MFSITPRIGTLTFSNIRIPRATSIKESVCGVVTMTAPLKRADWVMVS